jgi:hypothetical protein
MRKTRKSNGQTPVKASRQKLRRDEVVQAVRILSTRGTTSPDGKRYAYAPNWSDARVRDVVRPDLRNLEVIAHLRREHFGKLQSEQLDRGASQVAVQESMGIAPGAWPDRLSKVEADIASLKGSIAKIGEAVQIIYRAVSG